MNQAGDGSKYVRPGARVPERATRLARDVLKEPFRRRTWAELGYFVASSALAFAGAAVLGAFGFAGTLLTVVFVGVLLICAGLHLARGLGRWQRALARQALGEEIDEPEPFRAAPGPSRWVRATLGDRAAWRSAAYVVAKLPLTVFGAWFAVSVWLEALLDLFAPFTGRTGHVGFGILGDLTAARPAGLGAPAPPGPATVAGVFVVGVVLFFLAPWPMRLVVHLDRRLMHLLLGPDAATSRVRSLEQSRSRTLDTATETLQRIERNLHDGAQQQLVALMVQLSLLEDSAGDPGEVRQVTGQLRAGLRAAIDDLREHAGPPSRLKSLAHRRERLQQKLQQAATVLPPPLPASR